MRKSRSFYGNKPFFLRDKVVQTMTAKTLAILTLMLLTIPAAADSGVTRQQAQSEALRLLAAQGKRLASTAPFKAPAAAQSSVQGDLQSAGGDLQSPPSSTQAAGRGSRGQSRYRFVLYFP